MTLGRFWRLHLFPCGGVEMIFSYTHVLKYAYAEKILSPCHKKKSYKPLKIAPILAPRVFSLRLRARKKQPFGGEKQINEKVSPPSPKK